VVVVDIVVVDEVSCDGVIGRGNRPPTSEEQTLLAFSINTTSTKHQQPRPRTHPVDFQSNVPPNNNTQSPHVLLSSLTPGSISAQAQLSRLAKNGGLLSAYFGVNLSLLLDGFGLPLGLGLPNTMDHAVLDSLTLCPSCSGPLEVLQWVAAESCDPATQPWR